MKYHEKYNKSTMFYTKMCDKNQWIFQNDEKRDVCFNDILNDEQPNWV